MTEFDAREAAAAAKLCSACEHEASEHGTCVFCGSLRCGNHWEPPLRRPRLFRGSEAIPGDAVAAFYFPKGKEISLDDVVAVTHKMRSAPVPLLSDQISDTDQISDQGHAAPVHAPSKGLRGGFPKPSIDIEVAAREQFDILGIPGDHGDDFRDNLKSLLAQAWREGRLSPPGACCMNPYGPPVQFGEPREELPAELCQECLHHREMYRRVFGRWGVFDAAVVIAQSLMRESGSAEMRAAADEIDRVRMSIGGQP